MKPTPRILALQKQFFNQYKANKKSWVKKYGADAEKVMIGRAITLAKKMAANEQKQRIKEAIKQVLGTAPKKENLVDIISLDVPLMIRLLEYAREDAQTDMDLHKVAEKLVQLSKTGKPLDMNNYNSIIEPEA